MIVLDEVGLEEANDVDEERLENLDRVKNEIVL